MDCSTRTHDPFRRHSYKTISTKSENIIDNAREGVLKGGSKGGTPTAEAEAPRGDILAAASDVGLTPAVGNSIANDDEDMHDGEATDDDDDDIEPTAAR